MFGHVTAPEFSPARNWTIDCKLGTGFRLYKNSIAMPYNNRPLWLAFKARAYSSLLKGCESSKKYISIKEMSGEV
jgi:hypothetical protein